MKLFQCDIPLFKYKYTVQVSNICFVSLAVWMESGQSDQHHLSDWVTNGSNDDSRSWFSSSLSLQSQQHPEEGENIIWCFICDKYFKFLNNNYYYPLQEKTQVTNTSGWLGCCLLLLSFWSLSAALWGATTFKKTTLLLAPRNGSTSHCWISRSRCGKTLPPCWYCQLNPEASRTRMRWNSRRTSSNSMSGFARWCRKRTAVS